MRREERRSPRPTLLQPSPPLLLWKLLLSRDGGEGQSQFRRDLISLLTDRMPFIIACAVKMCGYLTIVCHLLQRVSAQRKRMENARRPSGKFRKSLLRSVVVSHGLEKRWGYPSDGFLYLLPHSERGAVRRGTREAGTLRRVHSTFCCPRREADG